MHLFRRAARPAIVAGLMVSLAAPAGTAYAEGPRAWEDAEILPGETLTLKPQDGTVASYKVVTGQATVLPAGWSVLSTRDGLKVSSPATASPGEQATITVASVADPQNDHDRFAVTVAADNESGAETSSGGWLSGLLTSIFG